MSMKANLIATAVLTFALGVPAVQASVPRNYTASVQVERAGTIVAKNGADNAAGDRGGHGGRGEGTHHASASGTTRMMLARNGADDGRGHEATEHANGHKTGEHGGRGGESHGGGHSGNGGPR